MFRKSSGSTDKTNQRLKFPRWIIIPNLIALVMVGLLATVWPVQASETGPSPKPAVHSQIVSADDEITVDEDLSPEEVAQLLAIQNGTLTGADLEKVKDAASAGIAQYGPIMLQRLDDKAKANQERRLIWVAVVAIGVIPALNFILFMVYPLVTRKRFRERAPQATTGRIYSIYFPQALLVTLVLVGLGVGLLGIQFMVGRLLGGVTNPQLVFQREAIQYIINDREKLIDDYTEMMVGLAGDIQEADPEKPVFDIILDNALQLKNDPLVNFASSVVKFVMPFLNYISIITFTLLIVLFLLRIRPDIMRLLTYPLDVLEAEHTGKHLPEFDSVAVGVIPSAATANQTTRLVSRKIMWTEIRVIAIFAVTILVAAIIMSIGLNLFFVPIVELLVDTLTAAAYFFLTVENAASTLTLTAMVLLLFVVECVVVFLVAFIFALAKVQDGLRQYFAKRITWAQTLSYGRQVGLRFGWLILVLAVLGMGLPSLVDWIDDSIYNHGKEPNWALLLIAGPLVLVIGLNLGLWLLRGFKMLVRIFTKSAAAEFGLNKPKTEKKEPVAA